MILSLLLFILYNTFCSFLEAVFKRRQNIDLVIGEFHSHKDFGIQAATNLSQLINLENKVQDSTNSSVY